MFYLCWTKPHCIYPCPPLFCSPRGTHFPDCWASKHFFLTNSVLRRVMELCFHSQLQSMPLYECIFLGCCMRVPSVLTAISSCCHSGAAITDLWLCCDLRGFQSPTDGARQLKWEKITSTILLLLQGESVEKHGSLGGGKAKKDKTKLQPKKTHRV